MFSSSLLACMLSFVCEGSAGAPGGRWMLGFLCIFVQGLSTAMQEPSNKDRVQQAQQAA
jgi:hypothetical protein